MSSLGQSLILLHFIFVFHQVAFSTSYHRLFDSILPSCDVIVVRRPSWHIYLSHNSEKCHCLVLVIVYALNSPNPIPSVLADIVGGMDVPLTSISLVQSRGTAHRTLSNDGNYPPNFMQASTLATGKTMPGRLDNVGLATIPP